MAETVVAPARETTARRLLAASAEHSFDPLTEIDWDAPLDRGAYCMPEHRVSLYGTPLWESMSTQQRVDLSRHEVASLASVGIWFEVILLNLLSRHVYEADHVSAHVQYALTEVADECRHSIMFARLIEKLEAPAYGPGTKLHRMSRAMFHLPMGPSSWASILIAEEILDTWQREAMADETVQPIVRAVNRIHVVEEARHMRFAREELKREVARVSPRRLQVERVRAAMSAFHASRHFIHPGVYAAVGLDVEEARRQVAMSTHRADALRTGAARLTTFLRDAGMIGGPSENLWRRARLL